jgi:hypothetical protein
MMKIVVPIVFLFINISGFAQEIATVNAERHTGGLSKLKNNKVFLPSGNPKLLKLKTLTESDKTIAALGEQLIDTNATTAILLIEKGEIIFEKYKSPATATSPLFSQSMSKSLTAYTIGTLLCDGKISSLDDRAEAYVPELKGTVFGESSIRHLLTMSSGAKDGITSGQTYIGEWNDIIFKGVTTIDILKKYGQRDITFLGNPVKSGEDFRYKAVDTYALEHVADNASGFFNAFEKNIWQISRPESNGYWLYDSSKHAQSASGTSFTARDWGRLAMYSLDQLKRGSTCMQKFMQEATSIQLINSSKRIGAAFRGYGYQTWIAEFSGKNSYWWVGYGGQRIGVDPESEKIMIITSWREDYMPDVYNLFKRWQNNK